MRRVPFGMSVSANTPLPWMPERRTMMRRPVFSVELGMSLLRVTKRKRHRARDDACVTTPSRSRRPRNAHCNLRREKIEVAPAVGLLHGIEKQLAITAFVSRVRLRRLPLLAPRRELGFVHQ